MVGDPGQLVWTVQTSVINIFRSGIATCFDRGCSICNFLSFIERSKNSFFLLREKDSDTEVTEFKLLRRNEKNVHKDYKRLIQREE